MSTGKKNDTGKPRWSLLPEGTIDEVIAVLEFGAEKYGADNWQHVKDSKTRYYDAAMRHIHAWKEGHRIDSESGESHLAHAICCLMFLLSKDAKLAKAIAGLRVGEIVRNSHLGFPNCKTLEAIKNAASAQKEMNIFLAADDTKASTQTDTDNCNTGDQTEVLPLPSGGAAEELFKTYPEIRYWRVDKKGCLCGFKNQPELVKDGWHYGGCVDVSVNCKYDSKNWESWKLDYSPIFKCSDKKCETEADDLNHHVAPSTSVSTMGEDIKRWDVVMPCQDGFDDDLSGQLAVVLHAENYGVCHVMFKSGFTIWVTSAEKASAAEAYLFMHELEMPGHNGLNLGGHAA